jgi:hypothetical protein
MYFRILFFLLIKIFKRAVTFISLSVHNKMKHTNLGDLYLIKKQIAIITTQLPLNKITKQFLIMQSISYSKIT